MSTSIMHLCAMMGTYPKTKALKSGDVKVAGAELEFAPIDDAMKGFKGLVRELKYDVAEVALSTFLQAKSVNKPYLLLPFVMNGKFHHSSLLRRANDPFAASELNGRQVAMRAYSQTTPTWVRGFLMDDFGVQVDKVKWLVTGEGHVAECADPPWVSRMKDDKELLKTLLDGDVDAILFGSKREPDDRIATVLEDPRAAALDWSTRNNAVPINHMVVIREDIANDRPDIVRAFYGALIESRRVSEGEPASGELDMQPYGFSKVSPALEIGIRYAFEQGLIPREFKTDELYGSVRAALSDVQ